VSGVPDVAELERRARRLLPADAYDYYAGGSGRGATLRASAEAWRQVWLAPRILRDVTTVDTTVTVPGGTLPTPIAVAPTAYHGLAHPDGELATAAGAARAGALFVLSTRSTRRIEEVAEVVGGLGGSWWFQVYVMRDRELTAGLVRRAAAAGAAALVLTGDTPVVGRSLGPGPSPRAVSGPDFLVNLGPLEDLGRAVHSPAVTFADIGWLAEISGGLPVVVKGVLRRDDALACAAHGAAAVIVSNHGGRQFDGAVPAAWALPGIAADLSGLSTRAGGQLLPAFADGGIRTGSDALAALALGARAVFIGRPVLWALACGGAAGVQELLEGLNTDLAQQMTLAGAASVSSIPAAVTGPGWPPPGQPL
jgi:4-hydroxymandelate oxidase